MNQIVQQLKASDDFLVATHANPDGDALGSLVAMGSALTALGKRTLWYNADPIPAVYRFIPGIERVTDRIEAGRTFQGAVVLDCGNIARIGPIAEMVQQLPLVINIDHHTTNSYFGHLNYVDTEVCACTEIVYHLLHQLGVTLDKAMATAIYTGILTDTGSFRFSNTNQPAFAICHEMVNLGVNPSQVAQHVYGRFSMGRIKLLNLALDTIEITPDGRVSLMALTQEMLRETGTQLEDADGLINYARRIEDVRVAVLIQETANGGNGHEPRETYHVSLRSDGSVDVSAIAAAFGGGGHVSAAGFNAQGSLTAIKNRLLALTAEI
ncbi:MAG: bifunctional oligoribonuclease/PAP phosphatase NrnA [Desulfobacterales bacterium]